jgi:hypothetical protein
MTYYDWSIYYQFPQSQYGKSRDIFPILKNFQSQANSVVMLVNMTFTKISL